MARRLPPPSVRVAVACLGGTTTILRHGSDFVAARARSGLEKRFLREAAEQFPNASPAELAEKAAAIRKLYFTHLTLARLRKQRERKQACQHGSAGKVDCHD